MGAPRASLLRLLALFIFRGTAKRPPAEINLGFPTEVEQGAGRGVRYTGRARRHHSFRNEVARHARGYPRAPLPPHVTEHPYASPPPSGGIHRLFHRFLKTESDFSSSPR